MSKIRYAGLTASSKIRRIEESKAEDHAAGLAGPRVARSSGAMIGNTNTSKYA